MKQLTDEVFTQVRKALLEATLYVEEEGSVEHSKDHQDAIAALDTAQPERAPLTDAEIEQILDPYHGVPEEDMDYIDHDGARREVRGCRMTVDHLDRHWIWSEQLEQNLVYKTKGRENALLAAIGMLLFIIQLRDERITGLKRIADLANAFADEVKPYEERHD